MVPFIITVTDVSVLTSGIEATPDFTSQNLFLNGSISLNAATKLHFCTSTHMWRVSVWIGWFPFWLNDGVIFLRGQAGFGAYSVPSFECFYGFWMSFCIVFSLVLNVFVPVSFHPPFFICWPFGLSALSSYSFYAWFFFFTTNCTFGSTITKKTYKIRDYITLHLPASNTFS